MRFLLWVIGLAALAGGQVPAAAQDSRAASHWRALTELDVEAAHRMLAEDHPGAHPEVGDVEFQRRLASAYATAKARAAQVTSIDGHNAVLAGLSVSLGDKHIWFRPLYQSDNREWAGVLIARRGKDWVVADEADADAAPLKGAKLLSCDGNAVDRLAEERLGGYRIVWSVDAQRVQRAYWLLLDDGNPFLKRPQACRFSLNGAERDVPLKWRSIRRTDLAPRLATLATSGAAGFGVRKVGDGWWIGLQSLSEKAEPVVEEVRATADELRKAPFVVLDMRGNGGGNSQYGTMLAEALLGAPFVTGTTGGGGLGEECPKVWRISDRNIAQVESYLSRIAERGSAELRSSFAREYEPLVAAKAAGAAFSGKARCPSTQPKRKAGALPKPEMAGRLILLTDNICFSSCLLVTDQFRRLGALHVGETTDANTNYMEVREDRLPSGLGLFSTLQAVAPMAPALIGPYAPELYFKGGIADTAALEKWIIALAAQPRTLN